MGGLHGLCRRSWQQIIDMSTDTNCHSQAFENTSTNVAASQMRNSLNSLIDTVEESDKKVCLNSE
jgi:hypothetical protein